MSCVGVEVAAGEYYRLLTVMVVHAGILHILLNMYALWVMGPTLERWLGRLRFASLYVLSGFAGGVASYLFNYPRPAVGRGVRRDLRGLRRHAGRGAPDALSTSADWPRSSSSTWLLPVVLPGAIDWRAHLGGLVAGVAGRRGLRLRAQLVPHPSRSCSAARACWSVCTVLALGRTAAIKDDPRYAPIVEQLQSE